MFIRKKVIYDLRKSCSLKNINIIKLKFILKNIFNEVKELRIDSTSWATPAILVNLLDFEPEKISIETENNANNDMRVHNIR